MFASRISEKMPRQFWKKTVFIIITVIITVIVYEHGSVATLQIMKIGDAKSYGRTIRSGKDETENQAETEKLERHPGFNVSFLMNKCRRSSLDPGDPKTVDLRVFVLTFNRAASVKRLLASLNKAHYGNDSVVIEVWIDRSTEGKVDEETLNVIKNAKFEHGVLRGCIHDSHVGIIGNWLIPWKPKPDSNEIALLLEDDMTVSPYFYRYLKLVYSKYRHIPKINGFSLQGISMKHNGEPGNLNISSNHKVFLYPTLGTWGFSPKAQNWIKFRRWFKQTYTDVRFVPSVPNHVGSGWYTGFMKSGKEDSFWEMWHICHSWIEQEWTLYPAFPGHKGLTFNWKENGLHYQGQSVTNENEDLKHLLQEWKPEFEKLPEMPIYVDNGGNILPPVN